MGCLNVNETIKGVFDIERKLCRAAVIFSTPGTAIASSVRRKKMLSIVIKGEKKLL